MGIVFNLKPLKAEKRDPVALRDNRTFGDDELHHGEWHKGYWAEEQEPEEVLVIGLLDREEERYGRKASGGESLAPGCLGIWGERGH
ncbi:Uu.00g141160.m01.CDS01 [Anthostomella pinea]|uniref:Uu.00g141160.m01.CDS01 n=1 Tax=Anthostomella pinea TaxID=933095 RepID=A0AAI8VQA6_9PEZI|nr:Uu.00g141160.m01.CDS01 [Anthostomella pinea]